MSNVGKTNPHKKDRHRPDYRTRHRSAKTCPSFTNQISFLAVIVVNSAVPDHFQLFHL